MGWLIAWSSERYGLAMPKYTVPSGPIAGEFHAPPVPAVPPADRSAGFLVSWNLQSTLPVFASSAYASPPRSWPEVERKTRPSCTCGAMLKPWPCFAARFAVRQRSFPVAAESANAYAGISPYTVPFATVTPFGPSPMGSEFSDPPPRPERCVHSTLPVLPFAANTL